MTPATHARLALRCAFMLTELLGELELAPAVDGARRYAMECSINLGAALEGLVTTLRGIERKANRRFGPRAKVATRRPKSKASKKASPVEKRPRAPRGAGRK